MVRHGQADDGVTSFVIRRVALFVLAHDHRAPLGTHDDLVASAVEIFLTDQPLVATGREQGRFVDQVRKIGTRETRGCTSNDFRLDVIRQRQRPQVNLDDLLAATDIRQRHDHLAVEAARAQQRRIQHVRAVSRGDDDHAFIAFKAVHLGPAADSASARVRHDRHRDRAAMTADRVDFVDEDDAGRVLLGLLEHVADAAGAHADEHLDEVRAGNGEERHAGFTRDRLGEQGLASTRRAAQQHAARDLATELLELARILQEINQFGNFLLGFLNAGNIVER